MKLLNGLLLLGAAVIAQPGQAADAAKGKAIAVSRCAVCHTVDQERNAILAESPPFEIIATKFSSNPAGLATYILAPHAKMNMTISRPEAEDVAAYILTLAK